MDWLLHYADKVFSVPSRQEIDQYLGSWNTCSLGYANQEKVRHRAASGGIVSALLCYLMEHDIIQGALVSKVSIESGHIEAHPFLARTPDEILQGQSSIYMEFPWLHEARPLMERAEGNLVVVGLPCTIKALRHLEKHASGLRQKIKAHISLICGRSSSKSLLLSVLQQKGIREKDVTGICFREGHWRGNMHVWLHDGSEITFPFSDFSLYRNLHFYCATKCLGCQDPLGEHAEIVCGDAWLPELKGHPIKHSLVISRTPQATYWLNDLTKSDVAILKPIPPETVFRAQRRGLIPAKRGKAARANLGKLFNHKINTGQWRSSWNDYLVAGMVLFNHHWSNNRKFNPLIFKIPKPLLRLYLAAMSLLKNF